MQNSSDRADLKAVGKIVQMYERMDENPNALESLLEITKIIQLIQERSRGSAQHALEKVADHVTAIATALEPFISAEIGPLIGTLQKKAADEIQKEKEIHAERIALIDSAKETPGQLETVYEKLLETGWKTHLSLDEWLEDSHERLMARETEVFLVGKLNFELQNAEDLFHRFVTNSGNLREK